MGIIHSAFVLLVAITPFLAFANNLWILGVIATYVALLLGSAAFMIGPGAATHAFKVLRIPIAIAAVPLLWLFVQLLPLSSGGVSQSLWDTAASALGWSLWPQLTIDAGLTLLMICRYLIMVAVVVLATIIATERQIAERLFFVSAAVTAWMSVSLAVQIFTGVKLPGWDGPQGAGAVFTAGSAYGAVLGVTIAFMLVERYLVRRSAANLWSGLLLPVCAVLCMSAIAGMTALLGGSYAVFAALCGCFLVGSIYAVRRLGLGFRAGLVVGSIGILAAITIVSTKTPPSDLGIAQRYAALAPAALASTANRMAIEVGPTGSGGGTFAAVFPLYGIHEEADATISPPTLASQIAIEMGRYALPVFVLLAGALAIWCMRGAFHRGRDFFYPAAGAAAVTVALVTSFCDASLANTGMSVFVASIIGVALAQCASRST